MFSFFPTTIQQHHQNLVGGIAGTGSGKRHRSVHKNKFTKDEDEKLKTLVEQYGENEWATIASHFTNRNSRQCRERWRNYMNPNLLIEDFTSQEDALLLIKYQEIGAHWNQIAHFFPNRSVNSVRNRLVKLHKQALINPLKINSPIFPLSPLNGINDIPHSPLNNVNNITQPCIVSAAPHMNNIIIQHNTSSPSPPPLMSFDAINKQQQQQQQQNTLMQQQFNYLYNCGYINNCCYNNSNYYKNFNNNNVTASYKTMNNEVVDEEWGQHSIEEEEQKEQESNQMKQNEIKIQQDIALPFVESKKAESIYDIFENPLDEIDFFSTLSGVDL